MQCCEMSTWLICEFLQVGREGVITVKDGKTLKDELEVSVSYWFHFPVHVGTFKKIADILA